MAIFNNHNHNNNHARAAKGICNEKRTFCAFVALLCDVVKAAALLLLQPKYKLAFRVQTGQGLGDGEGWEEDEEKERNGSSQTTSCHSFYYAILKKKEVFHFSYFASRSYLDNFPLTFCHKQHFFLCEWHCVEISILAAYIQENRKNQLNSCLWMQLIVLSSSSFIPYSLCASSSVYLPSRPQSLRRSLMSDNNSGFVSENIYLRLKQKLKTGLNYNKNVLVKGVAARTDPTEVCARNAQKKDFSFIIGLLVCAENQS